MEDEQEDDPRHRGRDPVGPEQQRPVDGEPADLLGGQHRQHQRARGHATGGDAAREDERVDDARVVVGVGEQLGEVVEPDEGRRGRRTARPGRGYSWSDLTGRPEEEDDGDRQLRGHQQVGQPPVLEDRPLHRPLRPPAPLLLVRRRELLQHAFDLATASSSPCLADFLPREDVLQLALDHVADLHEVAEPQALAVRVARAAAAWSSWRRSAVNWRCRVLLGLHEVVGLPRGSSPPCSRWRGSRW